MLAIIPFVTTFPFSTGKETSKILDNKRSNMNLLSGKNLAKLNRGCKSSEVYVERTREELMAK